jgi:hypothetical protein
MARILGSWEGDKRAADPLGSPGGETSSGGELAGGATRWPQEQIPMQTLVTMQRAKNVRRFIPGPPA